MIRSGKFVTAGKQWGSNKMISTNALKFLKRLGFILARPLDFKTRGRRERKEKTQFRLMRTSTKRVIEWPGLGHHLYLDIHGQCYRSIYVGLLALYCFCFTTKVALHLKTLTAKCCCVFEDFHSERAKNEVRLSV